MRRNRRLDRPAVGRAGARDRVRRRRRRRARAAGSARSRPRVALGAVVAPPDAVAATAVARRVGMPRRVVTILEGESLLNDATALVTLRTALAALSATRVGRHGRASDFCAPWCSGRARPGWLVAAVVSAAATPGRATRCSTRPCRCSCRTWPTCWPRVPRLRRPGVVVAGLILGPPLAGDPVRGVPGHRADRSGATVQFLLESVVFLLIGLQLRNAAGKAATSSDGSNAADPAFCVAVVADGDRLADRLGVPGDLPAPADPGRAPGRAEPVRGGTVALVVLGRACAAWSRSRLRSP